MIGRKVPRLAIVVLDLAIDDSGDLVPDKSGDDLESASGRLINSHVPPSPPNGSSFSCDRLLGSGRSNPEVNEE